MRQIDLILKYFPELSAKQIKQFEMLMPLYTDWNSKINLISRKDFDFFYERHVLHSLAIAKFIQFKSGVEVIDIGTGGGFPGIPLAIFFPEVNFVLVDSIAKKINVVNDVISKLGLTNVKTRNQRAEQLNGRADFIISRATAPFSELVSWAKHLVEDSAGGKLPDKEGTLKNGWIALKGGDLEEELLPFNKSVQVKSVSDYFSEPYFETKKVVYLPLQKL